MSSDRLGRRLCALEADAAPARIIIVVNNDPEPARMPGVRIVRVLTGVERSNLSVVDDAPTTRPN
jgi:hypothetical protein